MSQVMREVLGRLESTTLERSELVFELTQVVAKSAIFTDGDALMLAFPDGSAVRTSASDFVGVLIKLTLTRGANDAEAWFSRLEASPFSPGRQVVVVRGLYLERDTELVGGVEFISDAAFSSTSAGAQFNFEDRMSSAAVCFAVREIPNVRWRGPENSTDMQAASKSLWAFRDRVEEILKIIGCAERGAPALGRVWAEYHEGDLALVARQHGYRDQIQDTPLPLFDALLTPASALAVQHYDQLKRELKVRVGIAADRLASSRRRVDVGTRSIDASIALEALFGDDTDRMDFTYKLGNRAGLLLGSTLQERRRIRKAVREIYQQRGKVVHGSAHAVTDRTYEVVSEGIELATQALLKISELGAIDWVTLELGGGVQM